MVTRRAVLKGTAAASIGAIAAAHGAAPAEAADVLSLGYGQLTGGAIGGFVKQPNSFEIAVKFNKFAAEVFFKEEVGGIAVFFKFFSKSWSPLSSALLQSKHFPDLQSSDLYFSKLNADGAELFVKKGLASIFAKIDTLAAEDAFVKIELIEPPPIFTD